LVLEGLTAQTVVPYEVIIGDDGSDERTLTVIRTFQAQASCPIHHLWQENKGFRGAMLLNQCIQKSQGDYLLFLDGDCIPPPWWVAWHQRLAEPGYFVAGNRTLFSEAYTEKLLTGSTQLAYGLAYGIRQWRDGAWNKPWGGVVVPGYPRKTQPKRWKGAKTCNLGVFRNDLIAVNGFNETFVGWGGEDTELVLRLMHYGIHHKNGRFATGVFHLWHPTQSRSNVASNFARIQHLIEQGGYRSPQGLDAYED
jgi:glycosyltransferase involved in cell wall biosynthesis